MTFKEKWFDDIKQVIALTRSYGAFTKDTTFYTHVKG
jgi:hypothetical protein